MTKSNKTRQDSAPEGRADAEAYLQRALASVQPAPQGEFRFGQDRAPEPLQRRELLRLLGASLALAGASGCVEEPSGHILPYVRNPLRPTAQRAAEYATSMVLDGYATGLLVQTRAGRPIKIEGNPEHPASLGATGTFEQASILQLYDPDRARAVLHRAQPSSWSAYVRQLPSPRRQPRLWFVLPPQSSPHLLALIDRLQARYENARFVFHSPVTRAAVFRAGELLFERPLEPQYDFAAARVVVALDADFLASGPMHLRWARQVADRRRLASPHDELSRLYVAESMPTPTSSIADHRLPVLPQHVMELALALHSAVTTEDASWKQRLEQAGLRAHASWLGAVIDDLRRHSGASIVLAGEKQPPAVHALCFAINRALGNIGKTLQFTEPVLAQPSEQLGLADLVRAIEERRVDGVVVLEANPVYTAPVDLQLGQWLRRVPYTAHLSLHYNETSAACRWFLPAAHYLESWGDACAYDGTISLLQPMIRPMYGGKTPAQLIAAFVGQPDESDKRLLEAHWLPRMDEAEGGRRAWQRHLQRGFIDDTAQPPVSPSWNRAREAQLVERARASSTTSTTGLTVVLEPSSSVYDGRFTNNGWLLELPQPITKLTWGNAVMMSPATADSLGVADEERVEVAVAGQRVEGPVLTVPGHVDAAVTLMLGFGRLGSESLARGVGLNAFAVRTRAAPHFAPGASVTKLSGRESLARAQHHFDQHDRELALYGALSDYRRQPDALTKRHRGPVPSLLPVFEQPGTQWGMTIDTGICTGCSSCVVACQAENNIPIVGKRGVQQSREMHWLRIDEYRHGEPSNPRRIHQPMLCQHCEKAPCEYVCPVYATVHSPDGLNEMVYNRCVGTRFCSNNCPYKVRRFNWFEYTGAKDTRQLQYNPEVTVRARGVMEKCTYCVQRIRRASRGSEQSGAEPKVQTACQQACPTGAIQFGDLTRPDHPVSVWRRQPRVYAVLHHLGTRPRTLYLAKIFNPHPTLEGGA